MLRILQGTSSKCEGVPTQMEGLTIGLAILSILGTVRTFYFGYRTTKLERIKNSLTWKDVQSGSLELLQKTDKIFHPDILLMTSGPGTIVASLAIIQLPALL